MSVNIHLKPRPLTFPAGGLMTNPCTCETLAQHQELGEDGVFWPVCQQLLQPGLHCLQRLVQKAHLGHAGLLHVHKLWGACKNPNPAAYLSLLHSKHVPCTLRCRPKHQPSVMECENYYVNRGANTLMQVLHTVSEQG